MGLCKCPKKRVTNQFCYEHRVNVCEHCMVSQHPTCIVQSYLQWLQDSDYDPVCQLCRKELCNATCARLLCYHVYHWSCLNEHCQQMPPNTAPAGYGCPTCGTAIIPASNVASPVADALRTMLETVTWSGTKAETDSGMTAHPEQSFENLKAKTPTPKGSPRKSVSQTAVSQWATHSPSASDTSPLLPPGNHVSSNAAMGDGENNVNYSTAAVTSARKAFTATQSSFVSAPKDHDEDKYKRRSGVELLTRWLKSHSVLGGSRRRDPSAFYKRWTILTILIMVALFTLIYFMLQWGRASADSDPLLDPHYNPDIHVADEIRVRNMDVADAGIGAKN
uniref:Zinc finger protein-like 1 homolog n=1 Tax=Ornithodoros turicata TaxID=34597 RepID=A0A2R5LLV3_9ACAR